MQISNSKFVTLEYNIHDREGAALDKVDATRPFSYIHGTGAVLPVVEEALEGKSPGDQVSILIPSRNAYGERDDSLIVTTSLKRFEGFENIRVGSRFKVRVNDVERAMRVTRIDRDKVTLDGNHPFAGVDLKFAISVVDVRDATREYPEKNSGDRDKSNGEDADD
ncbi:MAG TPA: peptidylprolyl isomerase [Spirochaetia bacterium]|nr:peptidylprolyl isomerase [Spirochaetia bacterium]